MYRFLLKPKWIGFHLLCIGAVVGMISLGFWQLRRLDDRRQFNAAVRENTNLPVVALDELLAPGVDLADLEWRRVEAVGRYLPTPQFIVVNRSQQGTSGRNVVNPMRLDDGTLLIVNRGFVAGTDNVPAPPAGPTTVIGRLRTSEQRRAGQTADDGSQPLTEIRRLDIAVLQQQFDEAILPMYLELVTSQPAEPATVREVAFPGLGEGPHLSYTIQWFTFSACVAVGWVLAVRRSAQTRSGAAPRTRRGPPPIADEFR